MLTCTGGSTAPHTAHERGSFEHVATSLPRHPLPTKAPTMFTFGFAPPWLLS